MKHPQTKFDWFYEFRPTLILIIGILGLWSPFSTSHSLLLLSKFCGIVLILLSLKIFDWRYHYRKNIQN